MAQNDVSHITVEEVVVRHREPRLFLSEHNNSFQELVNVL